MSTPKTEVWIEKEVYGQAPEKHHFILSNGLKLKDLKDLINAFEKMPEDVFHYHVTDFKNDFSKWINDVFNDKSLAEELSKFHSRLESELVLQKHINKRLDNLIKKLVKK